MPTRETLLEELAWRGLLYQQTEGLGAHLASRTVTAYCGFDPTAPSLHIGNLVPTMLLVHVRARRAQGDRAGGRRHGDDR